MTSTRPTTNGYQGGGNDPAGPVATAAALAANARLEELRRAAGVVTRPTTDQGQAGRSAASTGWPSAVERGQAALEARRVEAGINYRPPTVEGAAWLAWAADYAAPDLDQGAAVAGDVCAQTSPTDFAAENGTYRNGTVGRVEGDRGGALVGVEAKIYPSLAAALQSSGLAKVGRLWFLLRTWDDQGRGFYDLDQVYQVFSGDGSPWHIGTRRLIQQLIKVGAGIFWTLRNRRGRRFTALQMTGPAGVALALKVGHLAGSPVGVPVSYLLGGMHKVNAGLFSAALTLRTDDQGGRPISRATLEHMTGAAASTQRTYIKTAGVEVRANYVAMPTGDVDQPGVFIYRGRVDGRPGRAILARRLPNSHDPQLTARPRGRVKKVNRLLNLVTNGARGETLKIDRIYHDTAAAAVGAWSRAYNHDHYWPAGRTAAGASVWGMVEAVNR